MISKERRLHVKRGYKYQFQRDLHEPVPELEPFLQGTDRLLLGEYLCIYRDHDRQLVLRISKGYAHDGASGPTADSHCFQRGPGVHDGLYQLGRERILPPEAREACDRIMLRIILEDIQVHWASPGYQHSWWRLRGISERSRAAGYKSTRAALISRAQLWYQNVRLFAAKAFDASTKKVEEVYP